MVDRPDKECDEQEDLDESKSNRFIQEKKQREFSARAANEDDDGYDPWSDRVVKEPFWEEDPWG